MKKILSILTISLIIIITYTVFKQNNVYVTGKYSKYCYKIGTENKNIKYKIYYKSLEECGKTL